MSDHRWRWATVWLAAVSVSFGMAFAAPSTEDEEIPCLSCAFARETRFDVLLLTDDPDVTLPDGEDTSEPPGISVPATADTGALSEWEPEKQRRERLPWNRQEKTLRWSYIGLSAVDAYQTINIGDGAREVNPLLTSWAGEDPGAAEVLLFKTATTWGMLELTDRLRSRKSRRWALILLNTLQFAVAVHNERVTGGTVF